MYNSTVYIYIYIYIMYISMFSIKNAIYEYSPCSEAIDWSNFKAVSPTRGLSAVCPCNVSPVNYITTVLVVNRD